MLAINSASVLSLRTPTLWSSTSTPGTADPRSPMAAECQREKGLGRLTLSPFTLILSLPTPVHALRPWVPQIPWPWPTGYHKPWGPTAKYRSSCVRRMSVRCFAGHKNIHSFVDGTLDHSVVNRRKPLDADKREKKGVCHKTPLFSSSGQSNSKATAHSRKIW